MNTQKTANTPMPAKIFPTLLTFLTLSILGIAGNYFHLTLFFSIDFIFGSIAALVALRILGVSAGVMVALIAGAYTYLIWGHPYAMLIFALEAAFVGVMLQRKISSLVLADLLYWVLIGMPLVWFFYGNIMGMADNQTTLILFKQPVNGITNAIIATYILYVIPASLKSETVSPTKGSIHLKELLFTTILAISFSFTLALIVYQSKTNHKNYERNLYEQMQLYLDFLEHQIVDNNNNVNTQVAQQDYHLYKYQRDIILLAKDSNKVLSSTLPPEITQDILNTGKRTTLENNIGLWLPERNNQPFMLWWKQAYYFIEKPINTSSGATLLLLQNSQSIINKLQTDTAWAFMLQLGLLIVAGIISYFVSNLLIDPILRLTKATRNVAEKLSEGTPIQWPQSNIVELQQLSSQAKLMSEDVNATFNDVNQRSSAIIEASVDAIITINDQGVIETFNRAAELLFGYSRDDVIGLNVSCLMPEPYQSLHDDYIHKFSDVSRKPFNGARRELLGMRKDGSVFPIELSLTTIKSKNQFLYTGIITDITQRKANEKLKQEFISTVSHELRTPLTSIQGAIKLLHARKDQTSSEESHHLLDLADRNVNRLAELINDLLDFEKLESDGIEYQIQAIEPDSLITAIIENDSPMANQAQVKLVQAAGCHNNIMADPARLTQVLSNLISNAIKFSPPGETIHIGCSVEGSLLRLYVKDNGEGIADEFKGRLFQRFSQADSSDTKRIQRGTGLGLAIARRMTEDMGGTIGFESTLHKGSTFFVSFPIIIPAT